MKRRTILATFLVMAMGLMVAQGAIAGPVKLFTNNFSNPPGGEFTLTGLGVPTQYVPGKTANISKPSSFETFCLEYNEHFSTNTPYDYTIDKIIEYAKDAADPPGKKLTLASAYLYYEFATGQLAGYDYSTAPGSARQADAAALQNAIWYLQGYGIVGDQLALGNEFVLHAADVLGLDTASELLGTFNFNSDGIGAYSVYALNLWTPGSSHTEGGAIQSHLILVPEPATILLLGLGILGAAAFGRKFRRT